jgi:hypothetical protein
MSDIGYVVVEFNQASHQPSIPMAAGIEGLEDAKITKLYYEGVARKARRRERYAIATVTIAEDDE